MELSYVSMITMISSVPGSSITRQFLQVMEFSSFSNVWYWIFLAFVWSRVTYYTLGVPYHIVRMAESRGENYTTDFEHMMRINASQIIEMFDKYGAALLAIAAFLLATIATLGFGFGFEIMQGTFLLMFPITIASLFSVKFARRVNLGQLKGDDLCRAYYNHRLVNQLIGVFSLVVISVWTGVRLALGTLS